MGRKYGVGGGQNALGYYRINRQDGTINFSSDLSGKTIFLEYISDGITATPGKDHIIKLKMAPSVKAGGNAGLENFIFMIKIYILT